MTRLAAQPPGRPSSIQGHAIVRLPVVACLFTMKYRTLFAPWFFSAWIAMVLPEPAQGDFAPDIEPKYVQQVQEILRGLNIPPNTQERASLSTRILRFAARDNTHIQMTTSIASSAAYGAAFQAHTGAGCPRPTLLLRRNCEN